MVKFSDYIVFADESGDDNVLKINDDFPYFGLVFCVFKIDEYIEFKRKIDKLKFDIFGNDEVILHERDIRRGEMQSKYLSTKEGKDKFLESLNKIIEKANFYVISTIINKHNLLEISRNYESPYKISLEFCMETLDKFLKSKNINKENTFIVIESRNKIENIDLELFANRIKQEKQYNILVKTVPKKHNSIGLQIADLIARPIVLKHFKPDQKNRAFEVIKNKLKIDLKDKSIPGIKVFP